MSPASTDRYEGFSAGVRPPATSQWTTAAVLLLVLLIPRHFAFEVATILFTPLRIFLICVFPFALNRYLSVTRGKPTAFDLLYFAFVLWTTFAIILNRGMGAGLIRAGQFFLEFGVVYLVARGDITDKHRAIFFVKVLFFVVCVLTVFAFIESALYRGPMINKYLNIAFGYPERFEDIRIGAFRLGLFRARTIFGHSIIMGLFIGAAFTLIVLTARSMPERIGRSAVVLAGTFFSLSSGPWVAVLIQVLFLTIAYFSKLTKFSFNKILIIACIAGLGLELFTGRGLLGSVELVTMNPHNFYYRKLIWNNGIDDVMRHPWFGFREEMWTRPGWMQESIDNFWLLQSMRGGIPSTLYLLTTMVVMARIMVKGIYDRDLDPDVAALRRGCLYMLVAFFLAGATVHLFDRVQPFFALMMGLTGAVIRLVLLDKAADDEPAARSAATRSKLASGGQRSMPVLGRL